MCTHSLSLSISLSLSLSLSISLSLYLSLSLSLLYLSLPLCACLFLSPSLPSLSACRLPPPFPLHLPLSVSSPHLPPGLHLLAHVPASCAVLQQDDSLTTRMATPLVRDGRNGHKA